MVQPEIKIRIMYFLGNESSAATINIPKLPACFTGTGDLFASLFLAWTYKTNNCLKEALEKTIGTLQAVLKRTLNYATGKYINLTYIDNKIMYYIISVVGISPKHLELKLIQSKADIEYPESTVTATIL